MLKQSALRWWTITRDAVKLWLACDAFTYAGALARDRSSRSCRT